MNPFLLDTYDYQLPPELIAQRPVEPRDSSRLLVVDRASGKITHRKFSDLVEYLDSNDLLVLNDTKVIRARLLGNRINIDPNTGAETAGGKIEFLLLQPMGENHEWEGAMASAARQIPGVKFSIPIPTGGELRGELIRGASETKTGAVVARFDQDPVSSGAGELPLPHYIERPNQDPSDDTKYNTVYARESGSAAAPTAGLHFTPKTFETLSQKGIDQVHVTLHVGLGTFRSVKVADVREHPMHEERYFVPHDTAEKIRAHKLSGGRIVSVGTTSTRTLESAFDPDSRAVQAGAGKTKLFLYPDGQSKIQVTDRLLTNFHLPKSTLLMLVSAFAGRDLIMKAYAEAVKERYRFFSYGDAMFIL